MAEQNAKTEPEKVENPDHWLWVDPFESDKALRRRMAPGAVLLSEDIQHYVNDYGVLFEREGFDAEMLKGASYSMTPHEANSWMFNDKGEEVRLHIAEDAEDKDGPYYPIPKHSLVYIGIKQRLRIPFYVIGRHNLKIRYVYQGLLLGTGPQVDPGYIGNLFIPLHNLTTREVRIYVKQSFVSIDFVRTTPLLFEKGVPTTMDELYSMYEASKHLFRRDKIERRTLQDYLGTKKPQSEMQEILRNYRETSSEVEKLKASVQTTVKEVQERQQGTSEALRLAGQQTEHLLERMEDRTGALQARVDDKAENIAKERRVDMFVVAGVMFAIVTLVFSGFIGVWAIMRDHFGNLDEKLFTFERRVSAYEFGTSNSIVDSVHAQMSNSVAPVVTSSLVIASNVARLENRIKELEAHIARAASPNTNLPPPGQSTK
jgi:deoxycytidine triphosphate deaminase